MCPPFRYKMVTVMMAAAIAGASGALNAIMVSFIEPEATSGVDVSVMVVLMALVGGRRHWIGPVIGASLMFALSDRLAGLGAAELSQLLTGALLIVVVVSLRGGIHDRWRRRPRAGLITLVVVFVVLLVLYGSIIEPLLFSLLAMVVVLVLPESLWSRLVARRRSVSPDVH